MFFDPHPVVKLFTPGAHAVWLLTELDPQAPSIAFGLGDLGPGFPEMGCVNLAEFQEVGVSGRIRFAQDARRAGRIVA